MTKIEKDIIKFLRKNRVSTTELADALGKYGNLPEISPITGGMHKVGKVRCIFTAYESNYEMHDHIRHIEEGEVVVVFTHKCKGRAVLGDVVSRFVLMYQGAEALVVSGLIRDVSRLRRERYAVWFNGITPIGCFNTLGKLFPYEEKKRIEQKYNNGIAVCDDGGVVIIPANRVNDKMLKNLQKIELQEDIWSYCLNTLKWDTKRIICEKEYLKSSCILPDEYKKKLTYLTKFFNDEK